MDINKILINHGILKGQLSDIVPSSPPLPITNFTVKIEDDIAVLSWNNPTDENFYGVRIQRKLGDYPTSHIDGTTIFNGVGTTFTDKDVMITETYYYRAFTYNKSNVFNNDVSQQVAAIPTIHPIYTVIINTTSSNPSSSVTYADNAVGMTAGSSAWDNLYPFNEIKPVMFKNGAVSYYLNPNDFAQKADGTPTDIATGNEGDVMIQFPKVFMYTRKVGNNIHVSLSKSKINENYKCFAHTKLGIEKNYSYIGAYLASMNDWTSDSVLFSRSGKNPDRNERFTDYRFWAENKGHGYQIISYYQLIMLQILYLIKYKNLNSQVAVGKGYTNGTDRTPTGSTNARGMTYGVQTNNVQMKLFGLEDLWGNLWSWLDGIVIKKNGVIAISDGNYNDEALGYIEYGQSNFTGDSFIRNVIGSNETPFIASNLTGASGTTYFCDNSWIGLDNEVGIACFGGHYNNNLQPGIFNFDFGDSPYSTFSTVGARLAFI